MGIALISFLHDGRRYRYGDREDFQEGAISNGVDICANAEYHSLVNDRREFHVHTEHHLGSG